jgi:prepilin-type N-terminal cleavage/methylation domain-containing protein
MKMHGGGRSQRGVTLIELVVVIAILAMMLGLAVVFLKNANRDLWVGAAANRASALLRTAHQYSRSSASPAWVVFRPKERTVHLLTRETTGEWHFEDETGAFGINAQMSAGSVVPGKVGKALRLGGGMVTCGEIAYYAPDQGISIEFWLWKRQPRGRQSIISVGKLVELMVDAGGDLSARVGNITVAPQDARLPFKTWCYIQVFYAAGRLLLMVDGKPIGDAEGSVKWTESMPLVIGGSRGGFNGIIDELRAGVIVPRQKYLLEREVEFSFTGLKPNAKEEYIVHFDERGRLDATRHRSSVRIEIKSPVAKHGMEVGVAGTLMR